MTTRCAHFLVVIGWLLCAETAFARSRFNPDDLFANPAIRQVSVSPTGEWIVALASHQDRWGVIAQRRGARATVPVYSSPLEIFHLEWVGNDSLFVRHSLEPFRKATLIRLSWTGATIAHDELGLMRAGHLVHSFRDEREVVLWAESHPKGARVMRGPITAFASGTWKISQQKPGGKYETVAAIDDPVGRWLVDRAGIVRAALALEGKRDPTFVLKYRNGEGERWREVWRARNREETFLPVGMTVDGRRLIVATHGGGDTIGLYEFDPESRELGRSVFSRPDVDVIDAVFDFDGKEIVAAVYEVEGQPQYHFLNGFAEKYLPGIESFAPGRSVSVTSMSRDHRFFSLLVQGAREPGSYFFYDRQTGERTKVGDLLPSVPKQRLVDIETVGVVSRDGTAIEAFLARPRTADGAPPALLVLPHGGPIGVRDNRSFDPLLQFIAIDGIAVLKVNYRGSAGYGKTFLAAGKREWARGIEDDVDAAVQATIDLGLVDPKRICIAGASYGGYSALVSAIRRPERYRCAASLNGPTDVPLLFQSSDFAATKEGRAFLAEMVGDPASEFGRLIEISPAYNVAGLEAPVLVAHGSQDRRVDPDHAYRLRAMLDLRGKPYEWLELHESGHSLTPGDLQIFARMLRKFLRKHLAPTSPALASGHPS